MRGEVFVAVRRQFSEQGRRGDYVEWEVVKGDRYIATAVSGVLAKRIANALNIYVPKSRRAKARRR